MKKREYHGGAYSIEYNTWVKIIQKCTNPRDPKWPDYGGRGIKVCAAWRESFATFLSDMGPRPKGMSIDRRKNDEGYEPGNCRWATKFEQAQNRRTQRNNKHGISGVHWMKNEDGFTVSLSRNGRRVYLGYTKDFFEACCLRKSVEANYLKGEL
jgi:hypothetical protein